MFKDFQNLVADRISFKSVYTSPANIAFVKYWGKKEGQIPLNPSLSMTLKHSRTWMEVDFARSETPKLEVIFEQERRASFETKIQHYLNTLYPILPVLKHYSLKIFTHNTFPHSSGIASSASSMSALALNMAALLEYIRGQKLSAEEVGNLARLASGSACRSLLPGFSTWGEADLLAHSSDWFATGVKEIHPDLQDMQDAIIVISSEEKMVTSSLGHKTMEHHPYLSGRMQQVNHHMKNSLAALKSGDMERLGKIIENEALSLHSLMMSAEQSYWLLKPQSLQVMEWVRRMREHHHVPMYFTIDAGPNIHLIFPKSALDKVRFLIQDDLLPQIKVEQVLWDELGQGPEKC